MVVPALLLLVGLALAGNYVYMLLSRRSQARLALRELQHPIKRRQQQVMRLGEALATQAPALETHLRRLLELSQATKEEAQGYPDEDLIRCENDLVLEMQLLELEMKQRSELAAQPLWSELLGVWTTTEESMVSAGEHYNKAVRRYNGSLSGFPGKIAARVLGLSPMPVLRR